LIFLQTAAAHSPGAAAGSPGHGVSIIFLIPPRANVGTKNTALIADFTVATVAIGKPLSIAIVERISSRMTPTKLASDSANGANGIAPVGFVANFKRFPVFATWVGFAIRAVGPHSSGKVNDHGHNLARKGAT